MLENIFEMSFKTMFENIYNKLTFTNFYYFLFIFFIFCIGCIITFLIILIILIILTYFILKYLKVTIEDIGLFNKYNKKSQNILNDYGDCKIEKIYLVKQPFVKYVTILLDLLTLYNYNKILETKNDFYPSHVFLMIQIKTKTNKTKYIFIEKAPSVFVSDNFYILENTEYLPIKGIKNKNYTLNEILNKTRERIGDVNFFYWHCYKNCMTFSKEILITINKYNTKAVKILDYTRFKQKLRFPKFSEHFFSFIILIFNISDKYIFRNF